MDAVSVVAGPATIAAAKQLSSLSDGLRERPLSLTRHCPAVLTKVKVQSRPVVHREVAAGRNGSSTAERSAPENGSSMIHSGASHVDDCSKFLSGRSVDLLELRRSAYSVEILDAEARFCCL
jgi:hypothetical protein